MSDVESPIWAVTCLFNPAGFRVRNDNYRQFRDRLPLPLLTVELGFDGQFSLGELDADRLIRIDQGARLWQKERLLNIGIASLPASCREVVWIDADILVDGRDWVERVRAALENHAVVQGFSRVNHLGPSGRQVERSNPALAAVLSADHATRGRTSPAGILTSTLQRTHECPCCGHVWGARREILQTVGLYDGCIVGGGDTAWVGGIFGVPAEVVEAHRMGVRQAERYRGWAERAYEAVRGDVGYVDAEVEHLWHGSMEGRRPRERHAELSRHGFDPYRDVESTEQGTWGWASDRPELHQFVSGYFVSRSEDDVEAEAAVH